MKKFAKQLTGLFLALVMVLSMSVSVFADGTETSKVTVKITYYNVSFGDKVENLDGQTIQTLVTVKKGGTVETAVREAIQQNAWKNGKKKVEVLGNNVKSDNEYEAIENGWKKVKDYYNQDEFHYALTSLKIAEKDYATVVKDTTTQWRGAGWTYSGVDGTTSFDTSKYMDGNTINQDSATVMLEYSGYSYNK